MGSKPATSSTKTRLSAVEAQKNVFLERYTDSPEFTHIDNPVVYMEDEALPEEQENEPGHPRRHPLSQVMNVRDVTRSPSTGLFRRLVEQRGGWAAEPMTISDDEDDEELDDDTFDFLL